MVQALFRKTGPKFNAYGCMPPTLGARNEGTGARSQGARGQRCEDIDVHSTRENFD